MNTIYYEYGKEPTIVFGVPVSELISVYYDGRFSENRDEILIHLTSGKIFYHWTSLYQGTTPFWGEVSQSSLEKFYVTPDEEHNERFDRAISLMIELGIYN